MNNLIVTPGYASQFSCIGAACEDSCCHDWTIIFDKNLLKPKPMLISGQKSNLTPMEYARL